MQQSEVCHKPTDDKFLALLRKYWGYEEFRGIQRNIIESIATGHDTLGLMPTGGGKSITFQVPALAMEGVCLVVTPLIALMKDQVDQLRARGIQAAAVHSGMNRSEVIKVLENAIFGGVKLLYLSPERLESPLFLKKIQRIPVSFIAVDEAHCISQWGYDFRSSYLKIADIRSFKPDAPVLALTATATPQVMVDIQEKLGFKDGKVYRMSFERANLSYVVRSTQDKMREMVHILRSMQGASIVYTRSRQRCKDLAMQLEEEGISATFYHAGLESAVKNQRQQLWLEGEKRVMVATNAFGMGIDKANVRLVIHYDAPDSIEAYFQEAGRAGRDGLRAYAVLLWNGSDEKKLHKRIDDQFPPEELVAEVYEHLAYFYEIGVGSGGGHTFTLDVDRFCFNFHHFPIRTLSALRLLHAAGYIRFEEDPDARARLHFTLMRHELDKLNELTIEEQDIITAVLRNYGGVFVDFVNIDLSLVAQQANCSTDHAYQVLKSLSLRHILKFIPQRKIPLLTYLRDRVEQQQVVLTPQVYALRKEQYTKRIEAFLEYATCGHVCRSSQLLRYFGEVQTRPCGCCDVCLSQHQNSQKEEEQAQQTILRLLADGKGHTVQELRELSIRSEVMREALRWLVDEGYIVMEEGLVKRGRQ